MRITIYLFLVVLSVACSQVTEKSYKDNSLAIEDRIDDLLSRMTLEEKVLQMNQWTYGKNANPNNIGDKMKEVSPQIGSLIYRSTNPAYRNQIQQKAIEESRLGIPIVFGFDVIHGYRTIFPIPLAQACSWNLDLVKASCSIAAKESRLSGIDWTFSPMVDVARDARWGRVAEGYGEDVYTNAAFGVAAIQGYQGSKLSDPYTIAACLKHYVGYSLSEGGRDYEYSDISRQTLWETFLPPFEAGVKAGAATVMSGFNDISGVPASANHYTLTEILKDQWAHDGFVVSDWGSVLNLIDQGVAQNKKEAALKSFKSGVAMDMVDDIYVDHLPTLVAEEKISMTEIDEAVRRILRLKFKLGLFDNPYVDEVDESHRYLQEQDLETAYQLAAESMVLLKNENQVLPISKAVKTIAVIGPLAKDSIQMMGSWEGMGQSEDVETIFESISHQFGSKVKLVYEPGVDFDGKDKTNIDKARRIASQSDLVIAVLGEKSEWSGENGSRSSIALPAIQEDLLSELKKTGKPIVLILSSGRPLELIRIHEKVDAMIQMWQPGTMGAKALTDILTGKINPSGKLAITFPLSTGQIPIHYNRRQSARPFMGHYQDVPKEPLYAFGHGLSYTTFEYDSIQISKSKISMDEKLEASITVSNTGTRAGKESVLWFISDPVASISRPMKELKHFEKKMIPAGEQRTYKFTIDPNSALVFPDASGKKLLEPGQYHIQVNNQKIEFELVE